MNKLIYKTLKVILRFNDRWYGRGASREVIRDLESEWRPEVAWPTISADPDWQNHRRGNRFTGDVR